MFVVPTVAVGRSSAYAEELEERMTEWAIALNMVAEFFMDEQK